MLVGRESLRDALKKIHDRLIAYKGIDSDLKERNSKNSGNKLIATILRTAVTQIVAVVRMR
jgi:hypothetical protein